MRSVIINQHGNHITDKYDHETKLTNYHKLITHMVDNVYPSVTLDGHEVTFEREDVIDGERVIFVNVGGL